MGQHCMGNVREAFATRTCVFFRIGLRKQMQHTLIFDRKNQWFPVAFPSSQSIDRAARLRFCCGARTHDENREADHQLCGNL